ncbi:unnamed protein product, partial [Meganyctiphanes norvegica]
PGECVTTPPLSVPTSETAQYLAPSRPPQKQQQQQQQQQRQIVQPPRGYAPRPDSTYHVYEEVDENAIATYMNVPSDQQENNATYRLEMMPRHTGRDSARSSAHY